MTAAQLAALTLGEADEQHSAGTLSQTAWEAYRRAWAMAGGARLGYRNAHGWTTPSDDPAVEELAAELVTAARLGRGRLPFEAAAA